MVLFLKNRWANFNRNWHKASLGDGDSSLFKWRALSFPRGNNYEIVKIHWRNFKIFSRTTGPISTKLSTKHPWMKGIQVSSNEGHCPFPKGDNYEIAKTLTKFKNLLLKNHWANLNQTWHKAFLGWRGLKFDQIRNHSILKKKIIIFLLFLINVNVNRMCLLIWTVFSGSDVDRGPLVYDKMSTSLMEGVTYCTPGMIVSLLYVLHKRFRNSH